MKLYPFVNFIRCDYNFDRWSFGMNIAYENYLNRIREIYIVSNILYWSITIGLRLERCKQ